MTEANAVEQTKATRSVIGQVVSNKMNKTIVVQIERKVKHAVYGKYIKRLTKMYVHDEDNASKVGDVVKIQQTRPLSRTKRWKLVEILKKVEQE